MKTLGKYEVLEELGTGSMGLIYRGRDTILDRDVALKTIVRTGTLDPELKERFYREAKACARIQHPNVVMIYELGEQDGLLFIALELLTGCDLRQFIAQRRVLPNSKKLEIMANVCDGLQHAHSTGIIHRDIKPSNIFLTTDNVGKILDFGVARMSTSKLTVVGRVLGTPYYMAPEQIMGKPCDVRSDIFALAIVIFEFLTFSHPFAGESVPKRIMHDAPDLLLTRNPDLPPDLEFVISKALAKDPDQRYQSADEFTQALRPVLAKSALTAGSVTATTPVPPPSVPPIAAKDQNTEFKMSEILGALQQFDLAIEQSNIAEARAALRTIERLAKIDDRFATAAKESHARLSEIKARTPQTHPVFVAPRPSAFENPPAPIATERPVIELRAVASTLPPAARSTPPPAAAFTPPSTPSAAPSPASLATQQIPLSTALSGARLTPLGGGDVTSLFNPNPPPPPKEPRTFSTDHAVLDTHRTESSKATATQDGTGSRVNQRTPAMAPLTPTLRPSVPIQESPKPSSAASTILIMAGSATVVVVIILAAYFLFFSETVAVRVPSLAIAEVAVAQARLFAVPSDLADVVVNLKKGDRVNVIHPPRSRSQEWTEAQFIAGNRVYPAGAIKTAELTNWSSPRPDIALQLLEMYAPEPEADQTELQSYIQKLSMFIQSYPGTSQKTQAQAEIDRTNAALESLGNRGAEQQPDAQKTSRP